MIPPEHHSYAQPCTIHNQTQTKVDSMDTTCLEYVRKEKERHGIEE